VKYSAKLIGIKDAFSKCQDAYIEEIEAIYKKGNETFRKLDEISNSTNRSIENTKNSLESVLKRMSEIDFGKAQTMLNLIDRVSNMSPKEIELMKKLIN